MKKLAFVFLNMTVGGAEKVFSDMLRRIDLTRYEVTVFTDLETEITHRYLDGLPEAIRVVYTRENYRETLKNALRRGRFGYVCRSLFYRAGLHLCRDPLRRSICAARCSSVGNGRFDCAAAYKLSAEDVIFTRYALRARRRCAWVHSSPETFGAVPRSGYTRCLRAFQKLFCVSQGVRKSVCDWDVSLTGRTEVLYNLSDADSVLSLADEPAELLSGTEILLSVGRLSHEKGQLMIPAAARLLKQIGEDFCWYVIGNGPLRQELEREIFRNGMTASVILLGERANPYPYMKQCTVFVQPSYTEGYCTATMEAKILCKPVVTTDAPGMREQFEHGQNGWIVPEMTPEALADGIRTLLRDPALRQDIGRHLRSENHDHAAELEKFYRFADGR